MTLTTKHQHRKDLERQRKLDGPWFECENCKELVRDGAGHPMAPYRICSSDCLDQKTAELGISAEHYSKK